MYQVRMQILFRPEKVYTFNNAEMAQAFYDGIKAMWNLANIVKLEIIQPTE